MLQLLRTTNENEHYTTLVAALDKELTERYPLIQHLYNPHNKIEHNATTLVALFNNVPVGCGLFKIMDEETIQIKRMYVHPAYRGKGIANTILTELENWAKEQSFSRSILETGNNQPEALALYKKCGYTVTENFAPYVGMETSICMCKNLR